MEVATVAQDQPDSWPAAPESSVARDDLGDGVAEDIGHAGEFPGVRLPSSGPERVHGAHLEPCEADWRVVPESVRRDGHAAAGDRYVPGPDVLPVFREQAEAPLGDVAAAEGAGDLGGEAASGVGCQFLSAGISRM